MDAACRITARTCAVGGRDGDGAGLTVGGNGGGNGVACISSTNCVAA